MKFEKYLVDQLPQSAVFMFCYIIIFLLLKVFRIDHELTLAVIFIFKLMLVDDAGYEDYNDFVETENVSSDINEKK